MAKVDRKILVAVSVILFLLVAACIYQTCRAPVPVPPPQKENYHKENYEVLSDDQVGAAPSSEQLLANQGVENGPRCGIREATHLGYKYAIPEECPTTEELMPEDDACAGGQYDLEATQAVPYVFTYPLQAAIVKNRLGQSADIWRGDLDIHDERGCDCDFKTIWNYGDHYVHGAFSDYTKKSHEIIGCNKQIGNNGTWVRNAPSCVANEQLVMDGDCGCN